MNKSRLEAFNDGVVACVWFIPDRRIKNGIGSET